MATKSTTTAPSPGVTSTLATLRGKRPMTFQMPLDDWQLLHHSAALKGTTAANLVRELLEPGLKDLRKNPPVRDDDE